MKANIFYYSIVVFVCLVITSCRSFDKTTDLIVLNKEYDIVLDKNDERGSPFFGLSIDYFDENERMFSCGLRWPSFQYVLYNVSDSILLDSVDFKLNPQTNIQAFRFLSQDTILLALNPSYERNFHDGILLVVDRNKNILDTIPLDAFPVKTHNNPDIKDPERLFVTFTKFPLVCKYDKIVIPMQHWGNMFPGLPNDSLLGVVNLRTKQCHKLPIGQTPAPPNYYWGLYYKYPCGVEAGDNVYVFFGSEPKLYKYNMRTEHISTQSISFHTIDTIQPYSLKEDDDQMDPYRSQYEKIFYDSTNHLLYWTAKIKCDTIDGPFAIQPSNFIYSFVIIDEDMKKIGEGILPEGYSSRIIPHKKGFLLYKRNQPTLTYTYFTYRIEKGQKENLFNQVRERRARYNKAYPKLSKSEAFVQYLKKILGADFINHRKFVVIPASSCPACVPIYAQTLKQYKRQVLDNKTAIILINDDLSQIKDFYTLTGTDFNSSTPKINQLPIFCDTTNEYRIYFRNWINLRCMELDSSKQNIVFDLIINPSNLNDLEVFISK